MISSNFFRKDKVMKSVEWVRCFESFDWVWFDI